METLLIHRGLEPPEDLEVIGGLEDVLDFLGARAHG
jgi:hypothetical protein